MSLYSKLKLDNIVLIILVLLFLSREEIFIVPIRGQKLLMFLIFFISVDLLIRKKIMPLFLKKGGYIIITNIYIVIIYFIGFGDKNDIVDLLFTYIVASSFFIIGLYWGRQNKIDLLKTFFFILFVLTFLNLIPFVFTSIATGVIHKRALAHFYGFGDNPMIMFWPMIFIIGFTGYFLNKERLVKRWQKYGFNFLFVIFIMTIIVSAFTAVVLMLTLSAVVLATFKFKDKISVKTLIAFTFAITFVIFLLSVIADGEFGELGGTTSKIKAIFSIFEAKESVNFEEHLNTASATRYSLLDISAAYFYKSPIIGNGYYFASVGTDIKKQVSSGHSSVFDFFAYFGLFAIPFLLIYLQFLFVSYKLGDQSTGENRNIGYVVCAVLVSYIFISFSNPYLQFSTIDMLFLLGGWVVSQYDLLKKNKRNKLSVQ